ncbi:MAG: glycoside hydrolase, partial [Phycisphaerae bacterium]
LPIHLTEISSRTADETQRADSLEMLFRVGYSHPKVDAILLWGFWAKRHWLGKNAALVDADWNYTEAGKRISNLLLKEWRTNTSKQTDADGKLAFRGFYGTYKVKLTDAEGNVRTGTVKLHPDSTSAAITLEPAGNK